MHLDGSCSSVFKWYKIAKFTYHYYVGWWKTPNCPSCLHTQLRFTNLINGNCINFLTGAYFHFLSSLCLHFIFSHIFHSKCKFQDERACQILIPVSISLFHSTSHIVTKLWLNWVSSNLQYFNWMRISNHKFFQSRIVSSMEIVWLYSVSFRPLPERSCIPTWGHSWKRL